MRDQDRFLISRSLLDQILNYLEYGESHYERKDEREASKRLRESLKRMKPHNPQVRLPYD